MGIIGKIELWTVIHRSGTRLIFFFVLQRNCANCGSLKWVLEMVATGLLTAAFKASNSSFRHCHFGIESDIWRRKWR